MRAYVPDYDLVAPVGLSEALALVAQDRRPIAGGTDLMVLFEADKLPFHRLVSLHAIAELRGIVADAAHVTIGALATYTEIQADEILRREFPLLVRAASWTGAVATQNRGTLAGNMANASPAADSPPALLVYDAEVELVSTQGPRWISYAAFHTGYKVTVMQPDEIIARIRLQRTTAGCVQYLRKVGTRRAQAISKVALAGLAHITDGRPSRIRIALASVAPVPLRCLATERLLEGRRIDSALIRDSREALSDEIEPIDDIRSARDYRREVAANLLAEFLESVSS
jgi:CO/xanthine dehydrogenase FAD-binding subunit